MGKVIKGNFKTKEKPKEWPTYSSMRKQIERDSLVIVCTVILIGLVTLAFLILWFGLK